VLVRTRTVDEETVRLDVTDRGTGIPEERLSKIFDPFYTTKSEERGVGLGLTVVYGIVQSHGGHIEVTSRVGTGTTFSVRLPIRPAGRNQGLDEAGGAEDVGAGAPCAEDRGAIHQGG
jgi:signal transduction histidine kinase